MTQALEGFQSINYATNEHGIITSPGKFEGEMNYAPYLWGAVLNGEGETNDLNETALEISADDVRQWSGLAGVKFAILWESEQGFVYCVTYESEKEFRKCFKGEISK